MNKIVVFGAGLIARPLVRYLLDLPECEVNVATRTVSKADKIIDNHPRGKSHKFDITTDDHTLDELVKEADVVVSLLPYIHHTTIAKKCIRYKKHMLTTSYVSSAMQKLEDDVKDAGIIILNEIGLDPGIDHMSAMKIIHGVQNSGGIIKSFRSYCGGLPAPEANTNPFGYKFSWSPRGVVLAAKNPARYLENNKEIFIPSEKLFENYSIIHIDDLGDFEAYPNRDSLPYIAKYGIPDVETMYRGTLRNLGWCTTWKKIVDLGLLDENERTGLKGSSYRDFMRMLVPHPNTNDIKRDIATRLDIDETSDIMKKFEWLGLLSDKPIGVERAQPLDIFANLLVDKLQYENGERDMIILLHEFIAEYSDRKEKITSTLIDYGIPGGDTSMARTVGLPAAMGVKLILNRTIDKPGIYIPVESHIYTPILEELESYGIVFKERRELV